MADDGGWAKQSEAGPKSSGDDRARLALGQLHGVLAELERRVGNGDARSFSPDTAAALAQALEALGGRLARHEAASEERSQALSAALAALTRLLEAQAAREAGLASRMDLMSAELAQVRAAQTAAPRDPALIRLILTTASAAAALSVVAAGVVAISAPEILPRFVAAPLADLIATPLRPSLSLPTAPGRMAVLAGPKVTVAPPASGDTFASVAAGLKAGDATALPRLTGLAQAGDVQAQLQLAALYEDGQAGLPRDLAAARQWTRRAAEGGERVAMHNLGLFLGAGEGGARDADEAAVWFRRAADRGVVDSQYNLGLLYEAGRGVERNLREAYRWYAIAANAGDTAAREKQVDLEARLKPAERADLDREADGFQPGAPAAARAPIVIPPAATVAETQALLARQGYYVGPIDGAASPTFRAAAAAYLRDHPVTAPVS